ncbi:hypothetical protein H0H87_001380 [Tephrocybe sp. NHM501043]|nr:hypothetical protein H0H87_001380 [Tephrocybe sp. NHM501043]
MTAPNSLGLDFDQLKIQDGPVPQPESTPAAAPLNPPPDVEIKVEKKKPYVNSERVKTGGAQRVGSSRVEYHQSHLSKDKLSEEALAERMARMKEQNEKIKQRRLVFNDLYQKPIRQLKRNMQDVQADEEAFRKTQESERAKLAQIRKVQEGVNRTREQNAKRKMDKIQSREWDSGKPTSDWKHQSRKTENTAPQAAVEDAKNSADVAASPEAAAGSPPREGHWARGGPRGGTPRGRGRGRGRGGSANPGAPQRDNKPTDDAKPPGDAKPAPDAKSATVDAPASIPTPSAST